MVATPTAHYVASVWSIRVPIALATARAHHTHALVRTTKVRTVFDIHEIFAGRWRVATVTSAQLLCTRLILDLDGRLVLLSE